MDWKQIKELMFDPYNWNEVTDVITETKNITVQKGCNGYTITNLGDTIVIVNNKTLFPSLTPLTSAGDSISLGGNLGEVYTGNSISVKFLQPVGVLPRLEIIQKYYTAFQ